MQGNLMLYQLDDDSYVMLYQLSDEFMLIIATKTSYCAVSFSLDIFGKKPLALTFVFGILWVLPLSLQLRF